MPQTTDQNAKQETQSISEPPQETPLLPTQAEQAKETTQSPRGEKDSIAERNPSLNTSVESLNQGRPSLNTSTDSINQRNTSLDSSTDSVDRTSLNTSSESHPGTGPMSSPISPDTPSENSTTEQSTPSRLVRHKKEPTNHKDRVKKKKKEHVRSDSERDVNQISEVAEEVDEIEELKAKLAKAQGEFYSLNEELESRRAQLTTLDRKILHKRKKLDKIQPSKYDTDPKFAAFTPHSKNIKSCQGILRRFRTRKNLKLFSAKMVSDYIAKADAQTGRLRLRSLQEILTTEKTYIENLEKLFDVFIKPLTLLAIVDEVEIENTFGDLDLLCDIGKLLHHKLEERINQWPTVQKFGDVILANVPSMKLYYRYIRNFNKSRDYLHKWEEEIPQYAAFIKEREMQLGGTLGAYLILPVQRLPRYELLLKAVIERTPPDHVDYQDLCLSLQKVKEVNVKIEQRQKSEDDNDALFSALKDQKRKERFKISNRIREVRRTAEIQGYLRIEVLRASLPQAMDSLVKIQYRKVQYVTELVKMNKKPKFTKSFVLSIADLTEESEVSFAVMVGKKRKRGALPATRTVNDLVAQGSGNLTINLSSDKGPFQIFITFMYKTEKDVHEAEKGRK
uniref:DH domain-containing protein n=1 Tax=Arcella intermedia TaxID=1963864 RepID=A0A6B2KZB9_9EUKA